MKKNILFAFLFLLSFMLLPKQVEAAEPEAAWIRVSPVILPLSLTPGKEDIFTIKVQNLLTTPLPLRVRLNDFEQMTEDGGYSFPDSTTSPLLSWITIDEKEFILTSQQTKTITLAIKSPKTIQPGGYYGMVFFEPVLPDSQEIKVATKIGVLMLGSIGFEDLNSQRAKILDFNLGFPLKTDTTLPLLLRVTNTSLRHFTAKPSLTITDMLGKTTTYTLTEKIIFPGKIRRWEELINPDIIPGIYKATIAVSTGNGMQIKQSLFFLYVPFVVIAGITGITILTCLFCFRKRIKRFFHVLLFNKP